MFGKSKWNDTHYGDHSCRFDSCPDYKTQPGSSTGRMAGFMPLNVGSTPTLAAKLGSKMAPNSGITLEYNA